MTGPGTRSSEKARGSVTLNADLTCPACGHRETMEMPRDACLFFHRCTGCGAAMRPKPGDCCVFCSYGSLPCPPVQEEQVCC